MVTYYVNKNDNYKVIATVSCEVLDGDNNLIGTCSSGETLTFKAPTSKISLSDDNAVLTRNIESSVGTGYVDKHVCDPSIHCTPEEKDRWNAAVNDIETKIPNYDEHVNNSNIHLTVEQKAALDDPTLNERVLNIPQLFPASGSGDSYDRFTLQQALNLANQYITIRGLSTKVTGGLILKFKELDGRFTEYIWSGDGAITDANMWRLVISDLAAHRAEDGLHAFAGEVKNYAGSTVPAGWLLCDGSEVSRTEYAALFAAIGTTWGEGDGSTTFNLPDLIDRVAWGATTAGGYLEAGLPNIEGTFEIGSPNSDVREQIAEATGAFSQLADTCSIYNHSSNTTGAYSMGVKLNASKSNSIYGNSETVQPPAAKLIPIIKY